MKAEFAVITAILCFSFSMISALPSFVASFQSKGGWSTDEWIEFNQPIPVLQEFTSCHWEKIRYVSSDFMSIWSYCIASRSHYDDLNCTQLFSKKNPATNYQRLTFDGWIHFTQQIHS